MDKELISALKMMKTTLNASAEAADNLIKMAIDDDTTNQQMALALTSIDVANMHTSIGIKTVAYNLTAQIKEREE